MEREKKFLRNVWYINVKLFTQVSDFSGNIALFVGVCVSWIMWNIREIMIFPSFAASYINEAKLMMILA